MKKLTRRQALNSLATAGAALALGLPSRLRAANGQQKLRLAFIGVGGRGRGNVMNFAGHEFVAFADVDDVRATEIYAQFPAVPRYRDYRKLLDRFEYNNTRPRLRARQRDACLPREVRPPLRMVHAGEY